MPRSLIHFFNEDISFQLKKKPLVRNWISDAIKQEGFNLQELNFIFCSDAYLLDINQQFLNHDTYTDIITFDNSESERAVSGDIFISIDRVLENAKKYDVNSTHELYRVMIHGTLHLLGYADKGKAAKRLMTQKEDEFLKEISF